jgi:DNA-binding CsgD family transcriptional regulator
VAAGFLSVVQSLGKQTPVLVAVDDLQWLDESSVRVLAFAARRISAPIGVFGAVRANLDSAGAVSWLQLSRADAIKRITLGPLALGALHALLYERLERSFPRPTMVRIHQVSGGNPFYALELARALTGGTTDVEASLPSTLAELVRARVGSLDADVRDALLAAACLADPTIEMVSEAIGTDAERLVEILARAEDGEIIRIAGNRLRFTHPLLAAGALHHAAPAERRKMHRRLGQIVGQPELRARHLALGATSLDPLTLAALDTAAESAHSRGAPAAGAELLDLALRLGGDTPQRRMRSAAYHFDAGDSGRAASLLRETIQRLAPGMLRAEALCQLGVMRLFDNSSVEAAELLQRALGEAEDNHMLRVQALIPLSYALGETGHLGAAVEAVDDAVRYAAQLGEPDLQSQALGVRVMLHFMCGGAVDEESLRRALELEDHHTSIPMPFRPSLQNALLLAWTGALEVAHQEILSIRRRCLERGDESDLIYVTFHTVLIEIWRGELAAATLHAEDAVERALQLGGDVSLFMALTIRAAAAAYGGRLDQARHDLAEAAAASQRSGSYRLAEWPITIVGFLELSLGNYRETLTALEPLLSHLSHLDTAPETTEIITASFVPDAVEAMIQLGRLADAESLIDTMQRNGRRLDRAWLLAVGARCRAMLQAARGDLDAALEIVQRAMAEHDRLPMPFERARTQLLLGQIQRRKRRKEAARATLHEALSAVEHMGMPLWVARVRAELDRCAVVPRRSSELTPAEQRVAELAASGMTNRDVATALFISPKTVEANLSRIYRKLAIHSRAELGRQIGLTDSEGNT